MSNNEAKFILSGYRPGGRAAADPAMAGALARAKRDPALGAWFAREQAHDAAVAGKLRAVVPPAVRREAILTGARMIGGAERADGGASAGRKGAPPARRAWWVQPVWLAAVAAVAMLVSLAAWRMAPLRGEGFEEFAVNFVNTGFPLQKRRAEVAAPTTWLGEQHGPLPEALPARFAELRALDCRTLRFKGAGRVVAVLRVRRKGISCLRGAARGRRCGGSGPAPRFLDAQKGGHAAATWADPKTRYVRVSDAKLEAVRPLL